MVDERTTKSARRAYGRVATSTANCPTWPWGGPHERSSKRKIEIRLEEQAAGTISASSFFGGYYTHAMRWCKLGAEFSLPVLRASRCAAAPRLSEQHPRGFEKRARIGRRRGPRDELSGKLLGSGIVTRRIYPFFP